MDILQATTAYETWLKQRIPLLNTDLRLKHHRMAESAFAFLRATFYRWVQLWPKVCPELAKAPALLGIGDLHVENLGTWRDREGRLIWGINDFDEVAPMPYTVDLVRLAASAQLAIKENDLSCDPADACAAILAGYCDGLRKGGGPFVLAEGHHWLRELAVARLRDPGIFWRKLEQFPTVQSGLPPNIERVLKRALPAPNLDFRVVHRQSGLGSLGRRRFTALGEWCGGLVAREAKELTASAWHWGEGERARPSTLYQRAMDQAVRVSDPFVSVSGSWLIRRLAPDCSRIQLASLPKTRDELKLLAAMGWETSNIHLGTGRAVRQVLKDLSRRPGKWLRKAADAMVRATLDDWATWRRAR